jgi:hypothetical protein
MPQLRRGKALLPECPARPMDLKKPSYGAHVLLLPGSVGVDKTYVANAPQRSIFRRCLAQYFDIARRNRQKPSSLGSIFVLHAFCRPRI